MRLSLGGQAVDLEELPAARTGEGEGGVSCSLVRHGVDVVARLDGDPQDWRSLTGPRGNGGHGLLLAPAAEAEHQEQAEAQDRPPRRFQSPVTRRRCVSRTFPTPSSSSSR